MSFIGTIPDRHVVASRPGRSCSCVRESASSYGGTRRPMRPDPDRDSRSGQRSNLAGAEDHEHRVADTIHDAATLAAAGSAAVASPSRGTSPTASELGIPDAASVHALIQALHAVGNEVRLALLDALVTLHRGRLFYELGYSSYHQYCRRELGLSRTTAYEYLRAGIALSELPQLRTAFTDGMLSWQQIREITRVASPDTENAWMELALETTVRELTAEVRESRRQNQDTPRDRSHGLPNLYVHVTFEMTLEEKERLAAALAHVASTMGSEGERSPLVRWADGILSGAIPTSSTSAAGETGAHGTQERQPLQAIVYHRCPECRRAAVETRDGLVQVSTARIEELEPDSRQVTIRPEDEIVADSLPAGFSDPPNTPGLVRQVLHRDGLRCQNPGCDSTGRLHAHHIVFRSEGGRTELSNEVAVCDRCHALIHAGLLEVTGRPGEGLTWTPRPSATKTRVRTAAALRQGVAALRASVLPPVPHLASPASGASGAIVKQMRHSSESARTDSQVRTGHQACQQPESRRVDSESAHGLLRTPDPDLDPDLDSKPDSGLDSSTNTTGPSRPEAGKAT